MSFRAFQARCAPIPSSFRPVFPPAPAQARTDEMWAEEEGPDVSGPGRVDLEARFVELEAEVRWLRGVVEEMMRRER